MCIHFEQIFSLTSYASEKNLRAGLDIIDPNLKMINEIKITLNKEFDTKDLGNARKILGVEIKSDKLNSCLFLQ